MSRVVLLDAGPLGLVTNPRLSLQSTACAEWLESLAGRGTRILVPEIADYEVRRELYRANRSKDGDMILAGQAPSLNEPDLVIATTNVGHLAPVRTRGPVAEHLMREDASSPP